MGGDANRNNFTIANKYLFADLLLFERGEGDEVTSTSFVAKNESIDASSTSLEAPNATHQMWWDANGSSLPMANKCSFANILLFESREGDEATSPSFTTENGSIDVSNSSLEAPIATHHMLEDAHRNGFTMANKCLFANLLLFESGEGDEEISPSFVAQNRSIDASNLLLKRPLQLITSRGGANRNSFTMANKCVFADLLFFMA